MHPAAPTRREFLHQTGALAAGLALGATRLRGESNRPAPPKRRLKVAAVVTAFFYRSHAHCILENFVAPYLFNGQWITPDMDVVALYADEFPADDLARPFAQKYNIPIYPTVAGALCQGGGRLAVDAVLSIGEHGNYPTNETGMVEYPRKRFFDEIVAVFRRSGRVVPVYNDKHLSYRWDWARAMYDTAQEMHIPFMAASSVPLAARRPPLDIPMGAPIEEAVSVYTGGSDSYDFHGMEVLQSMVEARRGGETGVARIQVLTGKAIWEAAEAGRWSPALAAKALEMAPDPAGSELTRPTTMANGKPFVGSVILIDYRSGLRGAAVSVGNDGTRWRFACRVAGEKQPLATSFFVGPWRNRNLFKALSHAIQHHFRHGRSPWPIERTLLTTGLAIADMDSRHRGGAVIETPQLAIAYTARDYRRFREMGATWKILKDGTPEPPGIELWKPAS